MLQRLCLVVLLAASAMACTKGRECDTCSSDEDCSDGRLCVNFLNSDGTVNSKRCGSGTGSSTCRVR